MCPAFAIDHGVVLLSPCADDVEKEARDPSKEARTSPVREMRFEASVVSGTKSRAILMCLSFI